MTRRPLAALVGLVAVAGCGADKLETDASAGRACPAGVAEVNVKDILPEPPAGTEIVRADAAGSRAATSELRKELGEHLRSVYTRVVAKPGRELGTLVLVMNIDETMNPRDVLLGAKDGAEEANLGGDPQPITIAGEKGAIVVGANAVAASGIAGQCSGVTLIGQHEAEVRAVAGKLQRAD